MWMGQPAPKTPPSCSMPSSRGYRRARRSRLHRSRPLPRATCSASRSPRSPRSGAAPGRHRRPRPAGPMSGDRFRSWPSRPGRSSRLPPKLKRRPTTPAPTPRGGPASSGCRAQSSIRRPWCSPPPWPPYRIPRRHTGPCCPSASSPRAYCRTPSSRASCWRGRPISAISPRSTGSDPSGRRSTAARQTVRTATTRKSTPLSSPRKARPCRSRCASAGAGCWATAPDAARAGRSPPSSSTTGCADGRKRSGSRSPTSCWRTRGATGPHWAGWRATSSRSATSGRAWRYPSTPASCSRPTPRCARRPARVVPRGWIRLWDGSPVRSTRRTATPSTA